VCINLYLVNNLLCRQAAKQSATGKDAAEAAAAAKLAKEQELEKKVLEPREKEPRSRGQHDPAAVAGYTSFI